MNWFDIARFVIAPTYIPAPRGDTSNEAQWNQTKQNQFAGLHVITLKIVRASRSRALCHQKREPQHHVNGCCTSRSQLHYPACHTTADRMAAHRKSKPKCGPVAIENSPVAKKA